MNPRGNAWQVALIAATPKQLSRDCSASMGGRSTIEEQMMFDHDIHRAYEESGIATLNLGRDLEDAQLWHGVNDFATVQMKPWGSPDTPFPIRKLPFSVQMAVPEAWKPWNNSFVIRYTTDDTLPDENSPIYSEKIELKQATTIRSSVFFEGGHSFETVSSYR